MNTRPRWYQKAKPVRNKKWSAEEKTRVYTMRVLEHKKVTDIIATFHGLVTPTQVYNIVRMMKNTIRGRCFRCGRKLRSREKIKTRSEQIDHLCSQCKRKVQEYKTSLRESALKRGLCGSCHKNKTLPGFTSCRSCLSITYRRRIAKGKCGFCGERPISKKSASLCRTCMEINRQRARSYN